ncbi:MAG: GtrA family protein [Bacteroidota bacterium]|jgi:putative flippase GtrA
MIVFLKAQFSSMLATGVDFMLTILFIEIGGVNYLLATIIGSTAGAFTNFIINKYWTFEYDEDQSYRQQLKYALVWVGSISLNALLSNAILKIFMIPYIVSKIVVSMIVGLSFNYQLQKHYVFKKHNNKIYQK